MTKAQLNLKPKHTLVFMATIKKLYKGGKKAAEKKSKPDLVNALYKAYKHKKVSAIGKHKKPVKKKVAAVGRNKPTGNRKVSGQWANKMMLRYSGLIATSPYNNDFYIFDASPFYALDVIADYRKYWKSGYFPEFKVIEEGKKLKAIRKGDLKKMWKDIKDTFTDKQNDTLKNYFS